MRPQRPDPQPLPPPAHLGLGTGETHPGTFADCLVCAEHLRAHPETPTPWGPKPGGSK